jgi:hypothetical protein
MRKVSIDATNVVASKSKEEASKVDQTKRKRYEMSKNLISEMMSKISLKSVSEENYPVSNETIERLMIDLDEELVHMKQ